MTVSNAVTCANRRWRSHRTARGPGPGASQSGRDPGPLARWRQFQVNELPMTGPGMKTKGRTSAHLKQTPRQSQAAPSCLSFLLRAPPPSLSLFVFCPSVSPLLLLTVPLLPSLHPSLRPSLHPPLDLPPSYLPVSPDPLLRTSLRTSLPPFQPPSFPVLALPIPPT